MDPLVVPATSDLSAHVTMGAVIVYLIEYLKRSHWFPWLDSYTVNLNKAVSAILAAIAAFGIGWVIQSPVEGTYVITLTGLTWTSVGLASWEFLKQYITQQMIFDMAIKKGEPPKVVKESTGSGGAAALPGVDGNGDIYVK